MNTPQTHCIRPRIRESARTHLEAGLAAFALFMVMTLLFTVKLREPSDSVTPPAKAYIIVDPADMQILDITGPQIFADPNTVSGYSRLRMTVSPLRPENIPQKSYHGCTFSMSPLAEPTVPDSVLNVDLIADWILMPPPLPVPYSDATECPVVILPDGTTLRDLLKSPETDPIQIAKLNPASKTLILYTPPAAPGLFSRVRLEKSCGVTSLDRMAIQRLKLMSIESPEKMLAVSGILTVLWHTSDGLLEGDRK